MSKKLLFNNYTINGLTPVQNGLVCWLDAYDLTSFGINSVWIDRTNNGNNGNVTTFDTLTSLSNGILYAKGVVDIPNPIKGLNTFTIEIGYQDMDTGYWLGLCGFYSGSTNTGYNGVSIHQTGNTFGMFPFYLSPPDKDGFKRGKNYVTFIFNTSNVIVYHNGEKLTSFNTKTNYNKEILPSHSNYLCFMSRKPNSVNENTTGGADYRLAKWYYIRIYNKELSEEEVLANYNYELSLQRGE